MKLKDTFKAGVLASQLKASWLNAVAWCINTLHGGTHINVETPAKAGEGYRDFVVAFSNSDSVSYYN